MPSNEPDRSAASPPADGAGSPPAAGAAEPEGAAADPERAGADRQRAGADPERAAADPERAAAEPRTSHSGPPARPGRGEVVAVLLITTAAAAFRFTRLGHQSFWLDESYTVGLAHDSFGGMLSGVAHTESTPPLYYALVWLWAKLFGTMETGLRSLSALFGTIAVPVAWRAAREWFGNNSAAGLVAAALTAVNPFFVWYSQEARSYSLLVLTATLTILFLGRAVDRRTPRAYALWAIAAAAALLTHYFAAFLVAPEAIWLLWTMRGDRRAWLASAAPLAVAAALAPLAIGQRDLGHTSFIAALSLRSRVTDLPKKLVTGELGTPTPLIGPLAGLIALAAAAYAVYRFRRPAVTLLALAAGAALIPLLLALLGADYLLPRNVIAAYVPLVLVVAAGLAALPRAIAAAGAAAICATAIVVNAQVATDTKLERDDWRGAAYALGAGTPQTGQPRAIAVAPDYQERPLRLYAGSLPAVPPSGIATTEVDVIANGRPPKLIPAPPAPSFIEQSRTTTPSYVLVRYRAPAVTTVTPAQFPGAALLEMKGPPK